MIYIVLNHFDLNELNLTSKVEPIIIRSRHKRCSRKKGFLKNFAKFTKNTSARVSFLIKLKTSGLQLHSKETLAEVFSYEFCKTFKNTFLCRPNLGFFFFFKVHTIRFKICGMSLFPQ